MMHINDPIYITLASQSLQRRRILRTLGILFQCWIPHSQEQSTNENVADKTKQIARNKINETLSVLSTTSRLILAADTLIELDGIAIGKPNNRDSAKDIISTLSGRKHNVYTSICLHDIEKNTWETTTDKSVIQWKPMSEEEIDWLLLANEWKDAAGAYMIQGRAASFVSRIEGSYSNILGLPIHLLYDMLSKYDFLSLRKH